MKRLLCVLLAMASPARADAPADARQRFEQGQLHYNLGELDQAIIDFDAAYKLDPDPAYLFNLAQAYRLKGNADRALFFYRRYIDLKPDAPNLVDVREKIAALTEKVAADKALAKARADITALQKELADKTAALQTAQQVTAPAPKKLRIELAVGAAKVFFSGPIAEGTDRMGVRVRFAYIKQLGKLSLDLGAAYNLTTVPYIALDESHDAIYNETYAEAVASYPLVGPLHAQLALGIGISALGPLVDGNGLTKSMAQSDAIAMFAAEVQAAFAIRIDPAIDIIAAPFAYSISPAAGALDSRVSHLTRRDTFFLGLRLQR